MTQLVVNEYKLRSQQWVLFEPEGGQSAEISAMGDNTGILLLSLALLFTSLVDSIDNT